MDTKFLDSTLRISPQFYEAMCIPLRITLASLFLLGLFPNKALPYFTLLLCLAMFGFTRKLFMLRSVWKTYLRAVLVYGLIVMLISYNVFVSPVNNISTVIGILLLMDVLMGIQSKHIFSLLGHIK